MRLLLIALLAAACQSAPTRPNIILFLVDDLGWQDTAVALTPEPTPQNRMWRTPNLDRLAASGLRLTDAYAAAPVCTPTRTSLLTGRTPGANHITYWTQGKDQDTSAPHPTLAAPAWRVNGLDASDATFPRLLAKAGYRTIHAGKAHFGAKDTFGADSTKLGFQVNIAGHAAGQPGSYLATEHFTTAGRTHNPDASRFWDVPGLEPYFDTETYLTEALAEEASLAIEAAAQAGQPFYLNFAPYAVHTPLTANPKWLDHFAELDPREAVYGTMIESVDHALGTLLAKLDKLGIAEDTVIVFTSDNGGLSAHSRGPAPDGAKRHHNNAPLSSGKGSAYEGGVRVPMVVRIPGKTPKDSVSATPVITYDLFPTFLDLAGVACPEPIAAKLEGADLAQLFESGADPTLGERALFWNQPHQWGAKGPGIEPYSAVRVGDWKLIYFHAGARLELFDVRHDLGEGTNLIAKEPLRARALAERLDAWIRNEGVQLSINKETGKPVPGPLAVYLASIQTPDQAAESL